MSARHRKKQPMLWLMTDERVPDAALLATAARLPKGAAGIVFRHHATPVAQRRALFDALRRIALGRRLILLLGGTAWQAAAWRADGVHGRDRRRAARPLLRSAPVHDVREAVAAHGVDLCFVSPLFPTRSHPGRPTLGRVGFAMIASRIDRPVIALGGVKATHRYMLGGIGADGWAAIDGLTGY